MSKEDSRGVDSGLEKVPRIDFEELVDKSNRPVNPRHYYNVKKKCKIKENRIEDALKINTQPKVKFSENFEYFPIG